MTMTLGLRLLLTRCMREDNQNLVISQKKGSGGLKKAFAFWHHSHGAKIDAGVSFVECSLSFH